jgi:uncharacterized phage protein (TIGR02218 family)
MTYSARETSRYSGLPFELYQFTSQGLDVWRMTSGDVARSYLSQIYTPEAIERTEINQDHELTSGSIKVTIPRTCDLASRFVSYIPSSPISLVIFRGHDGDSDIVVNFTGRVASATFADECELEIQPEQQALRRTIPIQKYQSQCNRVLYGPGCGVDKNAFKLVGTVLTVTGDTFTVAVAGTKIDGWLNAGYMEKGDEKRMILNHTGTSVQLINPMASLAPGDSVNLYAGCMRHEVDCGVKFNNLVNHWGFARIPQKNPFDGGLT